MNDKGFMQLFSQYSGALFLRPFIWPQIRGDLTKKKKMAAFQKQYKFNFKRIGFYKEVILIRRLPYKEWP